VRLTAGPAGVHEESIRHAGLDYDRGFHQDEVMRIRVALVSSAVLIVVAAPAHADPDPDARFLRGLSNAGITYHNGPDAMAIGRRVCELMDQGAPEADVINAMAQQNAGFSNDSAMKFAKVAEAVYCPTHLGGAPNPPPQWSPPIDFPLPPLPAAL
jgi:Protein of unknown function (DUF732)